MPFCTCPLADYQAMIAASASPHDSMTRIYKELGYKIRERRFKNTFANIASTYPARFRSSSGIRGYLLLEWRKPLHQQGLIQMAHEFLCTDGYGPRFWPDVSEDERDDRLRYSENRPEILEQLVHLFFKINENHKSKLSPLGRDLQHHGDDLGNAINVDNIMPAAQDERTDMNTEHTQNPQVVAGPSTSNTLVELVGEQLPIRDIPVGGDPQRQMTSPDQLQRNSQSQEGPSNIVPHRRVNTRRDDRGNCLFEPYSSGNRERTSAGPSRRQNHEATREVSERPIATENATMTDPPAQPNVEMENMAHNGAGNGSPQPTNMSRASEEPEDQEGTAYDNRGFGPMSGQSQDVPATQERPMEDAPQSSNTTRPFEELASPRSEPKTSPFLAAAAPAVHVIFSVQTRPWLNQRWKPRQDFFQYTLEALLEEMPWQEPFEKVLMLLEVPGGLVIEDVPRDDEEGFKVVLARYEQKIEALRMCYATLDREIVLEVSLEPVGYGQGPSKRVKALLGILIE